MQALYARGWLKDGEQHEKVSPEVESTKTGTIKVLRHRYEELSMDREGSVRLTESCHKKRLTQGKRARTVPCSFRMAGASTFRFVLRRVRCR